VAQFIQPTLEALITGDIQPNDAAYTLTAHIVARSPVSVSPSDDVSSSVLAIVTAVDQGRLSAQEGAARLVALRTKVETPETPGAAD